jgi:hypothetical protein
MEHLRESVFVFAPELARLTHFPVIDRWETTKQNSVEDIQRRECANLGRGSVLR